jgi:hypothetical protein
LLQARTHQKGLVHTDEDGEVETKIEKVADKTGSKALSSALFTLPLLHWLLSLFTSTPVFLSRLAFGGNKKGVG